jgi:hypothetical protein
MSHTFRVALLLLSLCVLPTMAQGGWVSTWTNTAIKPKGERLSSQNATMSIQGGKVRLEQPEVVTLIDYDNERFTLINPTKQYFWSGTIDEYLQQMGQNRADKMRETLQEHGKGSKKEEPYSVPKVDLAKLPPLSITKTEQTEKIAGYDTVKYQIQVDGTLFQEIWIAPTLDVSADLNPERYFAVQRKMSAAMLGKAAGQHNALYLNEEYRKLLSNAFVLKAVTHHLAGGFERVATSMKESEVADSQFEVPDSYRKVRLSDVLDQPAAAAAPKGS